MPSSSAPVGGWAAAVLAALIGLPAAPAFGQTRPAEPAATIGDRAVTLQELDDNWKRFDAPALAQAEQTLYDGRKEAFERMVAESLIAQAAKAKGLAVEKYLEQETATRRKPVTDADVQAFYNANKGQMQDAALADVAPSIRDFLSTQREETARAALVAELRKAGPKTRLALAPPRQTVSLAAYNPSRGPVSAPVTIVEYSDYQCPFCARVNPTLARVREKYGNQVRIVWKDFPLENIHPLAAKASEAAHCAGEQGKYWELHDRLFANQKALGTDALKQHAAAAGLEPIGFGACLDSGRHASRVSDGVAEGKALGIDSTPTLFINGRRVTGAQPWEVFENIVEDELARAGR